MSLIAVPLPALPSSAGRITAIHPLTHGGAISATAEPAEVQGTASSHCELLAVNDRAELLHVSLLQGTVRLLTSLHIPDFDPLKPVQIVTDHQGRYAAVSNRFGRYAVVFALPHSPVEPAKELIQLERGDYYTDKSVFPLAFAQLDQQTILIHGSDWNRLELTELPSLQSLASRPLPDSDEAGESSTESDGHSLPFLNYFHGRLHVSPDGSQIADTGWVWQPVGLVGAWSLREWLNQPWASENGSSLHHFFQTEDWDLPAAWVDHEHLALWGRVDTDLLDEEDYEEFGSKPVVVIYHVPTGQLFYAAKNVPSYLRSTAFVPSSECFPYPLGDMAVAGDRLFFWGRSVPLHVWQLPPMSTASGTGTDSGQIVDEPASETAYTAAPEPVTTREFYEAIYHPDAALFIDLQAEGRLQAFRLED
ncbi:hypothetical protein B9G55_17490 [Saccharibacillus sp. O16]|nr:hypothetical protein B9G55_17490 [Saccharibacillus sp. O16]